MANEPDFLDVKDLGKKKEEEEKRETIDEKLIRIEALLRSLISTLDKIATSPDPYEGKLEEIMLNLHDLKEQNKILAKSLLSIIKHLQSMPVPAPTNNPPLPPPPPK
ncbi:MAG: hypothetical protein QXD62_01295 [Candidatus Woesearchaeota archaeon]